MSDFTFTAAQLLAEAERELRLRKRVYPGRVAAHRMSPQAAKQQLALMEAITEILRALEESERLL